MNSMNFNAFIEIKEEFSKYDLNIDRKLNDDSLLIYTVNMISSGKRIVKFQCLNDNLFNEKEELSNLLNEIIQKHNLKPSK